MYIRAFYVQIGTRKATVTDATEGTRVYTKQYNG